MRQYISLVFLFACCVFVSCNHHSTTPAQTSTMDSTTLDPHSFAQPNQAVVKHLALDLVVNFESKKLEGLAQWQFQNKTQCHEIIFDVHGLEIEKVTIGNQQRITSFSLGKPTAYMGQSLSVVIEPQDTLVTIYYHTTADAAALQWLTPEQTADKKNPFLFTQSQAILARSWVPCQDGPGVRFSYEATIHTPKNLIALMSAADNPVAKNDSSIYHFHQPKPIPSYLLALAVGDISFEKIDNRCGVYAEPGQVKKVAWEFADMGKMVDAAEKLYGPYAWGRYDVLVLPPSFPFGGMENPCLTFATPTVVTGDRSLVALVAHELAHSWSGNLTTNATWNDFWLNEGFTVYFEQRIMEAVYGKSYSEMLAYLGVEDLKTTIQDLGANNPDTHLKLNLAGRDPDDGVTDIAYEKGFLFLRLLENKVGREKFDAFLKNYFHANAFHSMTTEKFVTILKSDLVAPNQVELGQLNMDEWIYGPGLPANAPSIVSERFLHVDTITQSYEHSYSITELQPKTKAWSTHEWLHFLQSIATKTDDKKMQELDEAFHFTGSANCEIADVWYGIAIDHSYKSAYPAMEKFLTEVGRRKYLLPLYKSMCATPEGKLMAQKIYAKARPNYHSVSQHSVDDILNGK